MLDNKEFYKFYLLIYLIPEVALIVPQGSMDSIVPMRYGID